MKEYIETILHQDVRFSQYKETANLPLVYRNGFDLQRMTISDNDFLLVIPVVDVHLSSLRKQHRQLEMMTGMRCVLYMKKMNYYARDTMIEEGIPFVWEGHQVYLPFMGVLLDGNRRSTPVYCARISFLTQKLLLTALYNGWEGVTVTKAAEILQVSKMSITRCFDEIEAMNMPYLFVKIRARRLTADTDKQAMWKIIRPVLRSPVITVYPMKTTMRKKMPFGGISALAHYSMLSDDVFPTFAVTKKDISGLELTREKMMPAGEEPGCIVHETGYQINFADCRAIDPLSVVLSLNDEDMADPRVSAAVDEMLGKYVW